MKIFMFFFYRITLELIQYTGYLTIEEITMFVFYQRFF